MKTNDAQEQPSVRRRSLLRGGAVLAGAGLTGTALAQPASAAAPAPTPVVLGAANAEKTATSLTVNGTQGDAATASLRLTNADGPSLYLNPLDSDTWTGSLKVGEIANTTLGPLIGVQDAAADGDAAAVTTILATGADLDAVATPLAVTPVRLVDTRTAAGRENILAHSANPFTADFKLRSGAYVDILVASTADGGGLPSVFVNITAVTGLGGYLSAYPPGTHPGTSTLNVDRGQTVANGAFVATGIVGDYYAIRIFSTAECWLVVDLTGAVVQGVPAIGSAAARRAAQRRPSIVRQMVAKIGRRR